MNEQPQQFRPGQVPGTWEHGRLQTISDSAQMVHNLSVAPPLTLAKTRFGMRLGIRLPAARKAAMAQAIEAGPQIRPVVLVTGASDLLEVRAVTYATEDQPITEGEYAWAGEKFQVYPDFGARYQDYVGLVSTDDPPNAETEFLLAYKVGPIWIVALPVRSETARFNLHHSGFTDPSAGDVIFAQPYKADGSLGEFIAVARAGDMQRTPFDRKTVGGISYVYSNNILRRATQGADSEWQLVIPGYAVGIDFLAAKGIAGGTGVTYNNETVEWIELNSARAWARRYEQ